MLPRAVPGAAVTRLGVLASAGRGGFLADLHPQPSVSTLGFCGVGCPGLFQ